MIRGRQALRDAFARGETVSLQGLYEGDGFRLATTEGGGTVFRSALDRLLKDGEAVILQRDIAGEPLQYGPAA